MAWTARADALSAQEKADAAQQDAHDAQKRATDIAEKSAAALDRANELAESHFEARLEVDRRRARAQWAALLRGWALSKSMRALLTDGAPLPRTVRKVSFAEVSDARVALDDESAAQLQGSVSAAINKMVEELGGMSPSERKDAALSVSARLVAAENLIEAWVANPAELAEELAKGTPAPSTEDEDGND